jgi:16S rRNA processing protein RimM
MQKRYLEAGQIVNTHGLKGEVSVKPWCNTSDFLQQFDGFYFGEGELFRKAESVRVNKTMAIVKFEGSDDIDTAMKLLRKVIYIDRDWVELPKGCYFEQDLLGLRIEDAQTGRFYGILHEVQETGANDIYRVDDGEKQVWIPAVPEFIHTVDLENGKILITPIKGMFDDAD